MGIEFREGSLLISSKNTIPVKKGKYLLLSRKLAAKHGVWCQETCMQESVTIELAHNIGCICILYWALYLFSNCYFAIHLYYIFFV